MGFGRFATSLLSTNQFDLTRNITFQTQKKKGKKSKKDSE